MDSCERHIFPGGVWHIANTLGMSRSASIATGFGFFFYLSLMLRVFFLVLFPALCIYEIETLLERSLV